jgi:membrane-associated phospholipid phosphatase
LSRDFWDRQPKWAIALVATLVHGLLYLLPNHFRLEAARPLSLSFVDRAVPFWPLSAWVYWSDYLLVFVAFRSCVEPGTTRRFVYALATLVLVGVSVHWFWPTVYPRHLYAALPDVDPLTRFVLTRFRAADSPASCFPSLHVAASYLGAFAALHQGARRGRLLVLWATAIFASTLTTKQHYFVDGVAGLLLAAAVWRFWVRRLPLSRTSGAGRRARSQAWAGQG